MTKNLVLNADIRVEGETVKEIYVPVVITILPNNEDACIWVPDQKNPGQWTERYHQHYEKADVYSREALLHFVKEYCNKKDSMES